MYRLYQVLTATKILWVINAYKFDILVAANTKASVTTMVQIYIDLN